MLVDDFIGKQIKDYVVLERIGQGGMATVYRAHQISVDRDVALKIIRLDEEIARTREFQERFAQEAKVIASLEHIHVLPVYDYGVVDQVAFLAMRWLRGGTVSGLLRQGPLSLERAVYLFQQIASGLAYAHSKGIIHRDLKASNILLDDQGNAYLSDFGLAKLLQGSVGLTQEGNIVGTPIYMSPEMLRGEGVDIRSDIYSLGMVLYHMMTGRLAYDTTASMTAIIYGILEKGPVPPCQLNPNIPKPVEKVILRALAKEPEQRFANADAMARALDAALGHFELDDLPTSHVPQTAGQFPTPRTPRSQHTPHTPRTSPSQAQGLSDPSISVYLPGRWRSHLGSTFLSALLIILILLVAYIALNLGRDEDRDGGVQYATVLAGRTGDLDDVVPGPGEIRRAQRRLGTTGFIAYVACTQDTDYHAKQAREMQEFATAYSLAYRVYNSNTDAYEQLTLIERARTDGAAGIILCPLNVDLLADTLTSVQRARLPLVILGSDMLNYGGVIVSGDEYQMGLQAGRFAGQIIASEMDGAACVIILDYPDLAFLVTRADGLEDGVLQIAPQATIVGRYRGATPDFGRQSVEHLLAEGVAFDVIVSINDAGAVGAIQALQAANIPPDEVVIVSIDAETRAIDYVRQGTYLRGTEAVDREAFSQAAINAMVRLLAGATLPETVRVPPGDMITASNLSIER